MDSSLKLRLAYERYRSILPERSNEVLDLSLNEDLSLSEIADRLSISRQAVHDASQRGQQLLRDWENKLGLLARELSMQTILRDLEALPFKAGELCSAEMIERYRQDLRAWRDLLNLEEDADV